MEVKFIVLCSKNDIWVRDEKEEKYYYIIVERLARWYFQDTYVAELLRMPYEDYKKRLTKFNAIEWNGSLMFPHKKDAERAAEWMESVHLANYLSGE